MYQNPYLDLGPGWTTDSQMCEGCHVRPAAHTHHKVFKQMGGRKGVAKIRSEDASNKIRLCLVCHDATHNRHATLSGFSCDLCPCLSTCFYGARLMGISSQHLTPLW